MFSAECVLSLENSIYFENIIPSPIGKNNAFKNVQIYFDFF